MTKSCALFLSTATCAIWLAACAGQQNVDPAEAVGDGKVFSGPENLSVEFVELTTGTDVLIRIGGTSSEIDSVVLDHQSKPAGKRISYVTRFSGRDLTTLENEGGADGKWVLHLPETPNQPIELKFSDSATKNLNKIELYEQFVALREAGSLAKVKEFDRERVQRREEMALAGQLGPVKEKCEADVAFKVDWASVTDDTLKQGKVGSHCVAAANALSGLCEKSPVAKSFAQTAVKEITCRYGKGAEPTMTLDKGKLVWAVSPGAGELTETAAEKMKNLELGDSTLKAAMALEGTFMCVYEKNAKYLVYAPDESDFAGLSYGDGAQFVRIPTPAATGIGWFYDPRNYNEKNPADHKGTDLRRYSRVEIRLDKQDCRLYCGDRRFTFKLLPADEAKAMAPTAVFEPAPPRREAHALAKDAKGNYYLVDRLEGDNKDWTLYVGKPGKLKKTPVKSANADGKAEVFAIKGGQLSVSNEAKTAAFVEGKKKTALEWLPVGENLQVIWGELGVYQGQRLGTPCDDF